MPAGTIALTNNSTAVTGSGTSFATELKANDFIVAVVGGVTYTLGVQSVNSATGVTLTTAYNGPTASGVAWTAVSNAALVGITAQVAADVAKAIRGLNLDKANWQQVFSASGNITVTLPDGSSFSGPSWNSMAGSLSAKLDKAGGTMTGSLTVPGIELQGETPYIDFHFGKTSADFDVRLINDESGVLRCTGKIGAAKGLISRTGSNGGWGTSTYNFYWDGGNGQIQAWIDASRVGIVSLTSTSDKGLKKQIKYREDEEKALEEVLQWKPADFKMKARGVIKESELQLGFIANDLVQVSPECVSGKGLPENYDIEADPNNSDAYYLNYVPMIAKLAQALQAQQKIIDGQSEIIKAMGVRLKDLDGLDG